MVEFIGTSILGGYEIHVTSESRQGDVVVPEHPVEYGLPLTDHIGKQSFVLSLSGSLVRPTPERVDRLIAALENMRDKGSLISFEGRRIYQNVVIEKFSIDTNNKISNGYRFAMQLRQIRVAKVAYIKLPPKQKASVAKVSAVGRKQTVNKKTSPVYHIVKRGDTYWGLSQKYAVSVQQMKAWNKYSERSIPINAKLRVG